MEEVHIEIIQIIHYGDVKILKIDNMRIVLIFLLLLTTAFPDKHEVTTEQLAQFYKEYITAACRMDHTYEHKLLKARTTKEVYEKIDRIGLSTYSDPVIRAQEIGDEMLNTANAKHLEDDWYMLYYSGVYYDGVRRSTEIPVKAVTVDGNLQITYFPHSGNGSKYGDDLLGYPARTEESDISQTSAQEFLESFYDVYLYNYCIMSLDLHSNLKSLRDKYFTDNALAQFKKREDDYLYDNVAGYDTFVCSLDFDAMWYDSLKFIDLGGDEYLVSFETGYWTPEIVIGVVKYGDDYLIDSVREVRNL